MKKIFILVLLLIFSLSLGVAIAASDASTQSEEQDTYDSLKEVLLSYYGDGTYKKDTTINIDSAKVGPELEGYFHARVTTLERSTYYTKDALWMSRGKEVAGVTYSYYGTSYDGDVANGLTNATAEYPLVKPDSAAVSLSGANQNGMEEYYVTLDDFIQGSHTSSHTNDETIILNEGWSLDANGVYQNASEGVLDGFRLFTAPLWLGKTEENANYIDFVSATVEVVDSKLVMKLWVAGDTGKLVDGVETDATGNALFSKAVVSLKQADGLLQGKSENLQAGLGTDFEGYSAETHPEIFDSSFKFTNSGNYITNNPNLSYGTNIVKKGETKAHGIWFADNNGNNALALQAGYNDMRLVQEDGNNVVKISKGNGTLTRVGMTVNDELKNPGTYVATIKVKAGSDANNVGKILFKLYDSSNIFASGNKTDGFYFRGSSSAQPVESMVKGEWITLSVEFTITKEISYTNDLCATFVVYNTYSSADSYVLLDDFEVYRVEDYGTDFEGFSQETQSSLFVQTGTISNGWNNDANGKKVLGVLKGYQGFKLFAEENGNQAVKAYGTSKNVLRVALNINDKVANPGVYKFSMKFKLGPAADNVGDISFLFHNIGAAGEGDHILDTQYYFKDENTKITLSKDGWVTSEVVVVITEKIASASDLCIVLMLETNNVGVKNEDNYVLIDDLKIEGYAFQ